VNVKTLAIARLTFLCLLGTVVPCALADGPPPTPQPPAGITNSGVIAPSGEPGQSLRIFGQVFAPDGITPAAGVIVYAYQTDAEGHYQNDPTTHIARLHGWAKTDEHGRFEFVTIRPAPYPNRQVPAHVHFHVWGAGYPLQWTKDLFFAGDPLLKQDTIELARGSGRFSNICTVTRDTSGRELCQINFRLLRETNYPAQYRGDPRTR
jgi:protocatechuate 3,4-dioxygenase beta subunit